MSLATATTWFFNFVLSVTWPSLLQAFRPQGAFGWYAAWNVVGFVAVLLFLPETKEKTLEELDAVADRVAVLNEEMEARKKSITADAVKDIDRRLKLCQDPAKVPGTKL